MGGLALIIDALIVPPTIEVGTQRPPMGKPPPMLGLYQPLPTKCLEDLANQESTLLPLTRRFMSSMKIQNRKAHGCGNGNFFLFMLV